MAEQFGNEQIEHKFKNPEEELNYLRAKVADHEKIHTNTGEVVPREEIIKEEIIVHGNQNPADVLDESYALKKKEVESIVLDLSPEAHDAQIGELINLLQEKGVLNTLSVVDKMKNPHLEDDFHRFLVQYIKAGFRVANTNEKSPVLKALKMTVFEVSLPGKGEDDAQKGKNLKELISKMEQFYSGMFSVNKDDENGSGYFVLELSKALHSNEIIFYISIPDSKRSLFEKQAQSIFPDIKLVEKKDDYNIFNESGAYVGSAASLAKNDILPLKTYELYDYDPLNIILNSFSKVDKDGEGASIQIIIKPVSSEKIDFYKRVLKEMEKGLKFKEALDKADSSMLGIFKQIGKDIISTNKKDKDDKKEDSSASNATPIENIKAKISSPITSLNIRVMASSSTKEEASAILSDIESAFNQFENTNGNKIKFGRIEGKNLLKLTRDFSFRVFSDKDILNLNLKELTTIMHLPEADFSSSAQLKKQEAKSAPAPMDLPTKGVLLGTNHYRNIETEIRIGGEDRLRHYYVIGQTGTGKTTVLKSMIRQDMINGEGVCFIDPHGNDIQEVLSYVPPERYDDLIYFDPGYIARPMGLNMLEFDPRFPEQKTFVVNEMMSIFNKLFDMKAAGGPNFEQYFRNSALLVMEDPESGCSLLDINRVLSDKSFREMKLSKCKNPLIRQFWENAVKTTGESSLANFVPYISSKFDVFLSNDIMRPIVSQEKSVFNFREIMDNKKILLVNLAKGRLGDINANLIGLVLVGKIQMAALSRTDSFGKDLPPFYLYIDEFQNITTDSICSIFSEARKYKLSLNVAHQYIAQLDEKIKDSVYGNVGTLDIFRVSPEDAEFLEKQLAPVFTAKDLMNIENHNSYIKLLANGVPTKPFSMETNKPPRGMDKESLERIEKLKQLSYLKYGKDRAEVEETILARYKKPEPVLPKL
jgi:hypothetical protein